MKWSGNKFQTRIKKNIFPRRNPLPSLSLSPLPNFLKTNTLKKPEKRSSAHNVRAQYGFERIQRTREKNRAREEVSRTKISN